jgi:paraquat-inducible protein B
LLKGGVSVTSPKEFESKAINFAQYELHDDLEESTNHTHEDNLEKIGF